VPNRTDEQLLEDYRGGDVAALRQLIVRYEEPLMRFLFRLVGDRQGAEDVFQEAFLQLHLSAHAFDPTRRLKPWLFTIAANKGRDYLRKKGRRQELNLMAPIRPEGGSNGSGGGGGSGGAGGDTFVDLLEIQAPDPTEALAQTEQSDMVQRAIQSLPLPLREILLLAYFQRLTYAQIADDLGIPLGTVKSRLHSAVAGFARAWQVLSQAQEPTAENPNAPTNRATTNDDPRR
jgi:RNA polymerase sigma-70 factor, ECF subfamily